MLLPMLLHWCVVVVTVPLLVYCLTYGPRTSRDSQTQFLGDDFFGGWSFEGRGEEEEEERAETWKRIVR